MKAVKYICSLFYSIKVRKWEWVEVMCHVPVSPAGISFVCFCLDSHGAWLGRDVGLVAGDTLVTGCVTAEITAILVWNPRAHLRLMFVCLSRKEQCGTTVGHGGVRGLWASSPHPSIWQQRSGASPAYLSLLLTGLPVGPGRAPAPGSCLLTRRVQLIFHHCFPFSFNPPTELLIGALLMRTPFHTPDLHQTCRKLAQEV